MGKPIPTELTALNIVKVLKLLAGTPARLEALGDGLSERQFRKPLGDGQRSFAEVLAHLLNSEARAAEAIQLSLLKEEPQLPDLHPERDLGRLARYDALPATQLLTYFRLRRAVLIGTLCPLAESQWARASIEVGKKRRESVYWKARALALHESEHVRELEVGLNRKT